MSIINTVTEVNEQGHRLVSEWAKKTCSIITSAQGGCSACDRDGDISILPIRYSAAHKSDVKDFFLDKKEIEKFTDIKPSGNSPVCYVYRKLRKGFLYVYDDHPMLPIWQCYMVSERGELTEFSFNKTVTLDDISNIKCTGSPCSSKSSLVSVRDSKTQRKVYFSYIEVPYSKGMLNILSRDKVKRKELMQSVEIGSISSCKEVLDFDKVKSLVLEYNDKICPSVLLKNQLYQGGYSISCKDELYRENNEDNINNLYFYATRKKDCSLRQSFALVIHDYIGMIEQLNYSRYMPFAEFSNNILPGDEGDDPNFPGKSFNENNYKWYMAVSQLKDIVRKMTPVRQFNIDPDFKADWDRPEAASALDMKKEAHDMTYKQISSKRKSIQEANCPETNEKFRQVIDEKVKKEEDLYFILLQKEKEAQLEAMRSEHKVEFYKWKRVESFYEKQWMNDNFEEAKERRLAIGDFPNYYDDNAYRNIEKTINHYKVKVDEDAPCFDEIYSKWVMHFILISVKNFEHDNPLHGLRKTNVISSMLDYGILGNESAKLWDWLENSKEASPLFPMAYSGGDKAISRTMDFINNFDFDDKEVDIKEVESQAEEFVEKSKDFAEKMAEAHLSYKTKGFKSLFFENELKDFFASLNALKTIRYSSRCALFVKDVGEAVKNNKAVLVSYRKANRNLAEHRLAEELERISPEFKNTVGGDIKYFAVELSGREIKRASKKFKKMKLGEDVDLFFDNACEKFEFYNNNSTHSVGNYVKVGHFDGASMKFYVASTKEFADDFAEKLLKEENKRKSSVDILLEACKEEKEKNIIRSKNSFQKVFGSLPSLLSLWILQGSVNTFIEEGGWDNFRTMVSDSFTVLQDACLRIESGISRRALRTVTGELEAKSTRVLAARSFGMAGKFLSYGVAGIALIQFALELSEIIGMRAKGEMSYVVRQKIVGASLACISAVAIGVFATSIIGGVVGILAEIAFLVFFDARHFLPENIMYWLRRSKYGLENDTVPGLKFKNIEQEQNALNLIWKGIVFSQEVLTGNVLEYHKEVVCSDGFCGSGDVPAVVAKEIKYKIIFPKGQPVLLKFVRSIDDDEKSKEGFWYKYDGSKGYLCPLMLNNSNESIERPAKNKKFSSEKFVAAMDEFGTLNKIDEFFSDYKRLSLVFYPEMDGDDKYLNITFDEEISVGVGCKKNLEVKFSFFIDEEVISDSYYTNIFHDDRRTV